MKKITIALTRQETIVLCDKIQNSNNITEKNQALTDIVIANTGLVKTYARKYFKEDNHLRFDDLVQEGFIGLITAAQKFDASYNTQFSTYAAFWIKASMQRAYENQNFTVRVPSYVWELNKNQVSDLGELTPLDAEALRKMQNVTYSWELEEIAFNGIPVSQAYQLLEVLDGREKIIIVGRFGINTEKNIPLTFRELGEMLGVSKQRVNQLYDIAWAKFISQPLLKDHFKQSK